ncbi:MAG: hypothetical protein RSC43_06965 [Clostridia bacterium]
MKTSTDYERFLKEYINFCIKDIDGINTRMLGELVEDKDAGEEAWGFVTYNPNDDENYHEGKVTLICFGATVDDDIMVLIDKSIFFKAIYDACIEDMAKYPESAEKVRRLLLQIQKDLGL